jgi:hypothetical protein
MSDGNDGTDCHNNSQANDSGNCRANAQTNSLAAAGLRMEALITLNPFLFQQEMLRRQQIERNITAASASSLRLPCHDAELEILSHRENELIRLRNAHSQMMEAEIVVRSDSNAAATAGIDGSFRPESIERIAALQEQRRRQAELMIGLPGRQLGPWAFNMLQQQNQSLSLAGLASFGAVHQWPASSFEQGFVFANRSNLEPNGSVHGQDRYTFSNGQGRFNEQPLSREKKKNEQTVLMNQELFQAASVERSRSQFLSEFNSSNQYSRHNPQQQSHIERLMRLQQLSNDQLMMVDPQFHRSESFILNGELSFFCPRLLLSFSKLVLSFFPRLKSVSTGGRCDVQCF